MAQIDKDKLRELASDPSMTTKKVLEGLGFSNYATFSYQLDRDPELRRIFAESRAAAGKAGASKEPASGKTPNPKGPRRTTKKKANTPPAMGMPKLHTRNSFNACSLSSRTSMSTAL